MNRSSPLVFAVGATGRASGLVICELARWGIDVRALVRDPARVHDVRANGAKEIVLGDLRDTAALEAALDGVDAVFHIGPAFYSDEAELGVKLVELSRKAGVRKFVFSSVIRPTNKNLQNHVAKQPVETALFGSGMVYTILQPTTFFQNIGLVWKSVLETGVFAEASSIDVPIARVDYRDVAEVAAIALVENRLDYGSFELSSEEALTGRDVAAVMSKVLRKEIAAVEISLDEWILTAGLSYDENQKELFRKVFDYHSAHGSPGNAFVLRAILGREPRNIGHYLRDLATRRFTTALGAS